MNPRTPKAKHDSSATLHTSLILSGRTFFMNLVKNKSSMMKKKKITYYFLRGSSNPVGGGEGRKKNITLRRETSLIVICFCLVAGRKQFSE